MHNMLNIINTAVCYMWKLLREEILRILITRKTFFSIALILYLFERVDVHYTHCGKHSMMYVSQIIKLYTLNLYSAVCQLYLNKPWRKKIFLKNNE